MAAMRLVLLSIGYAMALATVRGAALDPLLDDAGNVWRTSGDDFVAAHAADGFVWVSRDAKESARAARTGLSFAGIEVIEAIARFEKGLCKQFTLSLYNRGDAGDISPTKFSELLSDADKKLTHWSNAKGTPFKEQRRSSNVAIQSKAWVKSPHRVDMVWSFTESPGGRVHPEYVRLEITRYDPANPPRAMFNSPTATQARPGNIGDLRSRISRRPNGDVVLEGVPMVDQGAKGYCAAAVLERLLRYYGRDIDQHEIAQLFSTSARSGTSPSAMIATINKVGPELDIEVNPLQDLTVGEYRGLIGDYNRQADRVHKPTVSFSPSVIDVYHEMDADVLRRARASNAMALSQFKAAVSKFINFGMPLTWGIVYGKVPETPASEGLGGHLRLVIGYNDRANEILYTDTWGAGHELKRMPLSDAWAITLGLYVIAPRIMRF